VTADTRKHRSVSQLKQYKRCGYSYKLARLDHEWQRPAAWLPQGEAVHEVIEKWEKSGRTMSLEEAQDLFREAYRRHVHKYTEVTPNFEFWFRSGPYDGERDLERRYHIGLEQVAKYITWCQKHPEERIWVAPDGTPGIELPFEVDLDGVPVRGYIDLVLCGEREGEVIPRDVKTGRLPEDELQLAVYGVALSEEYGVEVRSGDFWMGKSGLATYPYDLTGWSRDLIAGLFRELDEDIKAERFEPDPEPQKCAFCDVNSSCPFAMG
jgi:putative RecB family exonuclease